MKLLVINGPNINFIGIREKDIYGNNNYKYLLKLIEDKAKKDNIEIETFQSNHEGDIIDRIQEGYFDKTDGIIINPGAFTHYSYGIRDALSSLTIPKVEVHISNIHKREEFRHVCVTTPVCDGQICGLGLTGYLLAIDAVMEILRNQN
jgi:3-dehydroquinate dehydratase II